MKTRSLQDKLWGLAGELAAALADAEKFNNDGTRTSGFRVVDALTRVSNECDGLRRICLETMKGHTSGHRRKTPSEYLNELRQKAKSPLESGEGK